MSDYNLSWNKPLDEVWPYIGYYDKVSKIIVSKDKVSKDKVSNSAYIRQSIEYYINKTKYRKT